jgi:peptidyl-prolyl cis-trans isomerase D
MAKRPTSKASGLRRRRPSRAEREARMQRAIIIGTIVVAVVVVGLIGFALLNDLVFTPNKALVTVDGDTITAREFQERVLLDYYFQTGGVVQQGLDPSLLAEYTLESMIDDLIIQHQAAERGIEVSDAEVEEKVQLLFGYDSGNPEPTPTVTPTRTPTVEPTATATFVLTPTPSPTPTLEPGVTPTATPTVTPTPAGSPTPTLTPIPQPTAVPVSEAEYTQQLDQFLQATADFIGVPVARVREMWFGQVRTQMLSDKLFEALDLEADDTKVEVHAAHILVGTEEEALDVKARLDAGEEFETLAAELSTDTSNAYKGGDLGWFGRGDMVAPFEEAAFALEPGEISDPVESDFGWHLIKLYDRQVVETTPAERESQRRSEYQNLIDEWRLEEGVEIDPNWMNYIPAAPQ